MVIHTRKLVTVSWCKVCSPIQEGGLGLRSIKAINNAAMLKISWEVLGSNDSWASFMRARYLKLNKPIHYHLRSSIWPGIKNYMNTIISNSACVLGEGGKILTSGKTSGWIDL